MKILVTGGAGFIASHIVDAYIDLGHEVAVIDNLSTGSVKNLNPKARFYEADIRDKAAVAKIFSEFNPEIVNHHAALASVVDSSKGALETYEINILGTANLLENCAGVQRFIFASTGGAMYGLNPKVLPADESSPDPISNYGVSKLLGEELIKFYSKTLGFEWVIFRYSNVFGPRQNPHGEAGVVAIFSKLLHAGQEPTVYNPQATRDYVFVSDIAKANVAALEGGAGSVMNLGWGTQLTNAEVFSAVARAFGYSGEYIEKPARAGEVLHICLSAEQAKSLLNWQPTVELEEGVARIKQAEYPE